MGWRLQLRRKAGAPGGGQFSRCPPLVICPRNPAATSLPLPAPRTRADRGGRQSHGLPRTVGGRVFPMEAQVRGHSARLGRRPLRRRTACRQRGGRSRVRPVALVVDSQIRRCRDRRAVRPRQPHRQPAARPDPHEGQLDPPPGTRGSCRRFRRRASAPGPARRRADRFGPLDLPQQDVRSPRPSAIVVE